LLHSSRGDVELWEEGFDLELLSLGLSVGGFGGGRVGEGGREGEHHEGVGVCIDGSWDRDLAGKWWER
jgi:hypothetical protein